MCSAKPLTPLSIRSAATGYESVLGTQGYNQSAEQYCQQYESVSFDSVHKHMRPYYPAAPAAVLDIGAGSGRDAAALGRLGYFVDAVEPSACMLAQAQALHHEQIQWFNDALPPLEQVRALGKRYDLILMTGVFFHLPAEERLPALQQCACLLFPTGVLAMSLRHGRLPNDRFMFDVADKELLDLAAQCGLASVFYQVHKGDTLGRDDVHWSSFVFSRKD